MPAFAADAVEVVVENDVDLGEDCDRDERPQPETCGHSTETS
jgi:hypothetical protein